MRPLGEILKIGIMLFISVNVLPVMALDPHKRISQYDIRLYTAQDGLPMNSIKKAFQDSKGYIWIGTQEGLVRFDGIQFKLYDKSQYMGLNCNFIWDIAEDADGNLWLATNGGGISCFDGNKFITFNTHSGLAHDVVNKILVAKDGTIWAGTENGLSHFKNKIFKNYHFSATANVNNVQAILESRKGDIYIGACYSDLIWIKNNKLFKKEIECGAILALAESRSQQIIIGSEAGKLNRFINGVAGNFDPKYLSSKTLSEHTIRAILEDKDGNLWFCTEGRGIFRYFNGRIDSLSTESGLPGEHNFVVNVMEDREGNLWFCSESGLIQLKDNKFITMGRTEGLASNYGHTVCEDKLGRICVGFRDLGFCLFDANIVKNYSVADGLPENNLLVIHPADDGGLWIGLNNFSLFRIYKDGSYKNYLPLTGRMIEQISAFFESDDNILWVGGTGFISKFAENRFTNFWFDQGQGIRSNTTAITQTLDGDIWVGSRSNGLYKIVNNQVTQAGILSELQTDGITALFADSAGVLWIGSDNHGLYRYQDDSYTNFTIRDGLFCDRLFSILEDDSAKLWFSTNKGIFSVRKNQFTDYSQGKITQITCQIYNHLDGMRSAETTGRRQPVAWKGRDGRLWFTSITGVVSIDPNNIPINKVKPPVYIEHIASKDSLYRWRPDAIHLQARERDLEFKYTALSFAVPERVRFRYQLEGYDPDWVDGGARRQAFYTNLGHGHYRFRVIACNNDGIWNEAGACIQFVIPPFWWETFWAYIGYFLVGMALSIWVVRWRYKRRFVKARLKLEHDHALRLEELDRTKSRFFAGISHEFRTPLTLIKAPLQEILNETRPGPKHSLLRIMLQNTERLERLVNQLLDLAQMQNEKLCLQARPVRLIPFLKTIVAAFESYAKREQIALEFESLAPASVIVYLEPEKMDKVMNNLLANALKYTPAGGQVTITVAGPDFTDIGTSTGDILIRVTDTGIGMPAEILSHIFDYFYIYRNEKNRHQSGTGIGLAYSHELVRLHHGKISVSSVEGVGTEFTLRLRLGQDHLTADEIASDIVLEGESGEPAEPKVLPWSRPESQTELPATPDAQGPALNKAPILLLVEDNPDMRYFIRRHLQPHYHLMEANDGESGLQAALAQVPDLVLSDVMMPGMDGFELCKQLKSTELTSHIPVILLTAKGATENKLQGLAMGAVDYLTKPFEIAELLLRIQNLIAFQRQWQAQLRSQLSVPDGKPDEGALSSADERFLQKVVEIVRTEGAEPDFDPEKLADRMALSRAHLNRKLKGLIGQKTGEFIRTLRLKQAAELLQNQVGSVSEIAYQVGFNHLSYFARCFKNQYGVLPSEYPKKSLNGNNFLEE